jgi:GNAT superfamily N-acetyltransferase
VQVVQIDAGDDAAFTAWFAVWEATDQELWPDKPGWQRAERLATALDTDGPEEHRCLLAHDGEGGGRVQGVADLQFYRRENLQLGRVGIRVLPAERRRGVGSALLQEAARIAVDAGRTELGGWGEIPVREGYVNAADPFAEHHGFVPVQRNARRELRLPLSGFTSPRTAPSGYSLVTFHDRWPAELIEERCELGRRMSTDVPMGEQELDEEIWDEERVRQMEAMFAAQNRAKVSTLARHDGTGTVAGFTEIAVPLGAPESAWQHDTLVLREHRGHGLGLAMKQANLAELVVTHPAVQTVSTWNAAENEHMIAVNEAMGFTVVSDSTHWLKKLEGC